MKNKSNISEQIEMAYLGIFTFLQPFIQIVIALAILDWAVKRFNIQWKGIKLENINVEKTIMLLIVAGFVVVAIKSGAESLTYLKDMALVMVGFYFGFLREKQKEKQISNHTELV